MRGAPPPPVIRPPNAAADHQFVSAQLWFDGVLKLIGARDFASNTWRNTNLYLLIDVANSGRL